MHLPNSKRACHGDSGNKGSDRNDNSARRGCADHRHGSTEPLALQKKLRNTAVTVRPFGSFIKSIEQLAQPLWQGFAPLGR
jgi:hypothetical protein